LIPALTRLVLKILDSKMRAYIEEHLSPFHLEQGGFLPNRSTTLQTFLLLLARDNARRRNHGLLAAFLYIKKAFDLIQHQHLLDIMRELKIPVAF